MKDYTKVQARLLATHLIESENRQKVEQEKQIEEMTKVYCKNPYSCYGYNCLVNSPCIVFETCKELYEQGYQKIPEDSVVLSKEEYKCLKSIEKSYDPFWFCAFGGCEGACKECKDTCEMSIFVKERKETAEKILKEIDKELYDISRLYLECVTKNGKDDDAINNYGVMTIAHDIVVKVAKQFGVEIKE